MSTEQGGKILEWFELLILDLIKITLPALRIFLVINQKKKEIQTLAILTLIYESFLRPI